MSGMSVDMARLPPSRLVQPHRRSIDLAGLTADEQVELLAIVRRLHRAGGYSPRHVRLTLSPDEERRAEQLCARCRWKRLDDPTVTKEEPPMPTLGEITRKRQSALSELVDSMDRCAMALGIPIPEPVSLKQDENWQGAARLTQCAVVCRLIAERLEAQQTQTAQGVAA